MASASDSQGLRQRRNPKKSTMIISTSVGHTASRVDEMWWGVCNVQRQRLEMHDKSASNEDTRTTVVLPHSNPDS